ncbi:MAG: DUF2905 family protein [Nitrospiraceae bacterium]
MDDLTNLGRLALIVGLLLALVGGLLMLLGRTPGAADLFSWIGRLPGDIAIKRDNLSVYIPLVTSLVVSVLLSLLVYLFTYLGKR